MENGIDKCSYYSFFTKYSLLDDYGFSAGLTNRFFKKILPSIPLEGSFEFYIHKHKENTDQIIQIIEFNEIEKSYITRELNLSIKALCSKIAAIGLDNKIVASNVEYRIRNSKLFLKNSVFAGFINKNGGAIMGNLSLGFFLGSAFLLSALFPFSIDIRHIAFSSSYVGYSIMSQSFDTITVVKVLTGIMIIGITNLIVSFSITLLLALKSRGAKSSLIPKHFMYSLKDFLAHPFEYFIIKDKK